MLGYDEEDQHNIEATIDYCDGPNCLSTFTDSEHLPENEGAGRYSQEPIETYCANAFGIYLDNDLTLSTCQHDKYDGWEDTSVTTKTAPPQVKTVERLNRKTKIHYWLVKQGG